MTNVIAHQGVLGAHSHSAAMKMHKDSIYKSYPSFENTIEAVIRGEVNYAVIPIENSYTGRVSESHHLLAKYSGDIYIVQEYFMKIEHDLVANKNTNFENIKFVYSHPQALMQSSNFITQHNLSTIEYSNTAAAASFVASQNDDTIAALASRETVKLYDLQILKEKVQNADDNYTIFVSLSLQPEDIRSEYIITSLLCSLRNIPASLYKALGGFATNQVNLLKLESYIPPGKSHSANFFITFLGSTKDPNVKLALEEMRVFCKDLKILGVYEADKLRNLRSDVESR